MNIFEAIRDDVLYFVGQKIQKHLENSSKRRANKIAYDSEAYRELSMDYSSEYAHRVLLEQDLMHLCHRMKKYDLDERDKSHIKFLENYYKNYREVKK